jgi:peptidoglycan hydrolase-like protein with peptidoglycan-binding domain
MMMTVPTSVTPKSPKASIQVLQAALNQVLKLTLTVDGKWGAKTTAAVKQFQTAAKITVDGRVGPITSGKLNASLETTTQ